MNKDLIQSTLEKYRKNGLYSLIGFCVFCLFINWHQNLNLGIVLPVLFSGLGVVHASAFYAMRKVLPLILEVHSNE